VLESLVGGLLRGAYLVPIVVGCFLAARHGAYLPLWQPQAGLVAAYVTYYLVEVAHLQVGLGVALALAAGTAFGAGAHVLFFQRCIDRPSPYTALVYGLAVIPLVSSLFGLLTSGYPVSYQRARGHWQMFMPPPVADTIRVPDVVAVVSSIMILAGLAAVIQRTRIGLEFRATCSNRILAHQHGLRVELLDRLVPAAAALLCSFGGLLYALKFGAHPQSMLPVTVKAVAIIVALGSGGGVLAAGVAVVVLSVGEAAVQATPAISAFEHALAYCLLVSALLAQFVLAPRVKRWYWARRSPLPSP
jgi:branched-subunit amino acid ABC-type transport system permease component